jgi:hypothetical protein
MSEVKRESISWIRHSCRACGGDMIDVWEMGAQRINSFPSSLAECDRVPKVPLTLARCHPCGLIQLRHSTNPDLLFGVKADRPYWYFSGVNESMVKVLKETVQSALDMVKVETGDVVVDIGANDGTLLSFYPNGVKRVAFEPALNMMSKLMKNCELYVGNFFPYFHDNGPVQDGSAKIVTSAAMFYDLEDPLEFCLAIKKILHPKGVWVNQLAYLPSMLANNAWDGICHEHATYWTLTSLAGVLEKAGLQVIKATLLPKLNEGSVRFFITHRDSKVPSQFGDLRALFDLAKQEEEAKFATTNEPYLALKKAAEETARVLRTTVLGAALRGEAVDLLGASTKGNVLLQYCALRDGIRRAVERSEEKWGKFTVNGIPITSEEVGRADPAKWLICLPWAFREALLAREKGKWPAGTRMIFPMPKVEVVDL